MSLELLATGLAYLLVGIVLIWIAFRFVVQYLLEED